MGYRKITVEGVEYQYTVGRTHVKIRGLGVWPKEEVGKLRDQHCKCCGEPMWAVYPKGEDNPDLFRSIRVQPSDVAEHIRKVIHSRLAEAVSF